MRQEREPASENVVEIAPDVLWMQVPIALPMRNDLNPSFGETVDSLGGREIEGKADTVLAQLSKALGQMKEGVKDAAVQARVATVRAT